MLFAIIAMDKPDALSLRMATRQAHFDYALGTEVLRLGGPFLNADGEMIGSLIVIEAADLEAARRWHTDDPYVKAGLFASSDVHPWKATANRCGANF
ncbi:MAG TPA: YciI family protein [Rhizomicrobium sp.]